MRSKSHTTADVPEVKYTIKVIQEYTQLPTHYIGLPDNVEEAIKWMNSHEEKLNKRGFRVPRPLQIYSLTTKVNHVPSGKKIKVMERMPFTMFAVAVEKLDA